MVPEGRQLQAVGGPRRLGRQVRYCSASVRTFGALIAGFRQYLLNPSKMAHVRHIGTTTGAVHVRLHVMWQVHVHVGLVGWVPPAHTCP